MTSKNALLSFESMIRADSLRGILPAHYLKKLESKDQSNPEFLDRQVDHDWQMFRKGYLAAQEGAPAESICQSQPETP